MKRVVVSIVLLAFALLLPSRMLAQWVSVDGPYVDAGGVFAQVGSNLFVATENYVFRSTNNGDSWTPVNNGLPEDGIYSLLGVGTKLYAGADASSGSLYVSSDSGASWKMLDMMYFKSGIKQPVGDVMSLASLGENLFVGTSYGLVLRSDNEGDSWTLVKGNMSYSVTLMAHESTLYAGTHRVCSSTNQGNDWTDSGSLLSRTRVVSFAKIATHLFAATNGVGVIHSPDDGITWDTVDNGLPDTTVNTLLASGNALFAGTRSRGVYVSSNYGASWSPSNNGLTDTTVASLIEHGKYLFASTPNQGILRSSDQGASWTEANIGFSGTSLVRSILSRGEYLFAGTDKGGAYRHNGVNWRSTKVGLQTEYASSLAVQDSVLFVGVFRVQAANQLGGVFRSSDYGDSWRPYNTGPSSDVWSLAVNDANVFAGTQIGVYRSTDYGDNWNAANGPIKGGMGIEMRCQYILSLASIGTTIFAGGK
ncbi:MAG: hypothetical protein IPH49_00885 [Ignavibacteria bacterium]|nr:hypothetical protein [Ignavibacteria bacterium]